MPRVPFAFTLTGGGTKYGTPFVKTDTAFTNAVKNLILGAIETASQSPSVYGITLPPTTKQYKITKVFISSELTTDDAQIGMWNGSSAVEPLGKVINGNGTLECGDGVVVPAGYIPFVTNLASSGGSQFSGYFDWSL